MWKFLLIWTFVKRGQPYLFVQTPTVFFTKKIWVSFSNWLQIATFLALHFHCCLDSFVTVNFKSVVNEYHKIELYNIQWEGSTRKENICNKCIKQCPAGQIRFYFPNPIHLVVIIRQKHWKIYQKHLKSQCCLMNATCDVQSCFSHACVYVAINGSQTALRSERT